MKVVSSQKMAAIESQAYRAGASAEEFMEEAGAGIAHLVHQYAEQLDLQRHTVLLCGKGNNAGDAYVSGIHLIGMGYSVFALQLFPYSECSDLCKKNHDRFVKSGGQVHDVENVEQIALPMRGIIVDGIFGTGFKGKVEEPIASIIASVNASGLPIIAVDIPSGLNGDTGIVEEDAIQASMTAFLGLPKTGFFLADGWDHVGNLHYVDFGLGYDYIDEAIPDFIMLTAVDMHPLMPSIKRTRHKYEAGYVVGLAGSSGMPGAAILSSWATLAGGAGFMRLLHPNGLQGELAGSPYEIVKTPVDYSEVDEILTWINQASAVFIGPGLGRDESVGHLLQKLLPQIKVPTVLDADALFFLSESTISLPEQTILTPHKGEMERLLKKPVDMESCRRFSEEKKVTLILKGAPTFIFHPGETPCVNITGDPGMATAGSGDVLTGLVTALLAQGLSPFEAAKLGAYLHGLAGEHAARDLTSYCMMASDIIKHFPEAFE